MAKKKAKSKKKDKPAVGLEVSCETTIKSVLSDKNKETIKFDHFNLDYDEAGDLTEMIRRKNDVELLIELEPKDKGFPAIMSTGVLVSCVTNITNQNPKINRLRFSTDQIAQICGYIQAETPVKITIVQPQGDLTDLAGNEEEFEPFEE